MFFRSWSEKLTSASRSKRRRRRAPRVVGGSPWVGYEALEGRLLLTTLTPFVPAANNPYFAQQWNLNNTGQVGGIPGADINVLPAWQQGYTGTGVTVSVVDSGVYYQHPDLAANYNPALSYNYFENTPNAQPPLGPNLLPLAPGAQFGTESHGTEVAGIIAGTGANGTGTLGVAPNATIASARLIASDPTGNLVPAGDAQDYAALLSMISGAPRNQQVDIYSNGWGPIPSLQATAGSIVGNNSLTAQDAVSAMQQGDAGITPTGSQVLPGRGGLGNVYVFAAGDNNFSSQLAQQFGPQYAQYTLGNTNDAAETASRFAATVAALGPAGQQALYSNPGASILVSAPGGYDVVGAADENGLPTSSVIAVPDSTSPSGYDYQTTYTDNGPYGMNGTAAAAANVSGVVALMLQANPKLSWRDVQEILAESATENDPTDPGWTGNGAGFTSDGAIVPVNTAGAYIGSAPLPAGVTVTPFHVNGKYGFGEVNATAAVNLAKTWTPLQPETSVPRLVNFTTPVAIPDGVASGVSTAVTFTSGMHVEHAQLVLNTTGGQRGDLQVTLTSPNGTTSILQAARNFQANGVDNIFDFDAPGTAAAKAGVSYTNWSMTSTRDWGQSSAGTWTVTVADLDANGKASTLNNFTLTLYGTQDYAPIAQDFSVPASQGQATAINVLAHTYDTDGTNTILPGSVTIDSQPTGGTVSVTPAGQVIYTPAPGFHGLDTFTYQVSDNTGVASRVATVTVNVGQVITAPVANNIQVSTTIGTPISVSLLANVTDNSGTIAPTNITIVNQPNFGTVTVNPNTGVATYTPGPNFINNDTFTYQVTDSNNLTSNVATVTVNLSEATPVAASFSQPPANENVTQQVNILAYVSGSSSPSGVSIVTPPAHGTTVVDPVTGVVNYTPAVNFFGSDSFNYAVANTQGALSNAATVTLTVLPQGVPIALSHEFVLAPDGTVMNGIKALDNPTNSGNLTATLVTQGQFGTVTLNSDGTFTYSRGPNFQGIDTFTYTVNNGQNTSTVGSIRLVTPNVHFIENLYHFVLNRTGADAELTAWAAAMRSGMSQSQVAAAVAASPEALGIFIRNGYQQLLGRPADAGGFNYWLAQMRGGMAMEQFLDDLAGSPEYYARHGSTVQGLVTAYYHDFLNRDPSANDLSYWSGQLVSGVSSYQVAMAFLTSAEYRNDYVISLYQTYYGSPISAGAATNFIQSLLPNVSRYSIEVAALSTQQFYVLA